MQYYILDEKKLIIFWSPKCGCSTMKHILATYLKLDSYKISTNTHWNAMDIHKNKDLLSKSNKRDIKKIDIYKTYDIVMLVRNPYERLVSGFLNKYVPEHGEKILNCDSFHDFCHLISKDRKILSKDILHHIDNQTSGLGWEFYNELQKPSVKYALDTSNVNDIAKILGMNIQDKHFNYNKKKYVKDIKTNQNLGSLKYDKLKNISSINYSNFYNHDIEKLVYNIYKDDFIFFNNNLEMNYKKL